MAAWKIAFSPREIRIFWVSIIVATQFFWCCQLHRKPQHIMCILVVLWQDYNNSPWGWRIRSVILQYIFIFHLFPCCFGTLGWWALLKGHSSHSQLQIGFILDPKIGQQFMWGNKCSDELSRRVFIDKKASRHTHTHTHKRSLVLFPAPRVWSHIYK